MQTLNDQWHAYRDACYPDGTTATQNRECHQAFMAGALAMTNLLQTAIDESPNDDAKAAIAVEKIHRELNNYALIRTQHPPAKKT